MSYYSEGSKSQTHTQRQLSRTRFIEGSPVKRRLSFHKPAAESQETRSSKPNPIKLPVPTTTTITGQTLTPSTPAFSLSRPETGLKNRRDRLYSQSQFQLRPQSQSNSSESKALLFQQQNQHQGKSQASPFQPFPLATTRTDGSATGTGPGAWSRSQVRKSSSLSNSPQHRSHYPMWDNHTIPWSSVESPTQGQGQGDIENDSKLPSLTEKSSSSSSNRIQSTNPTTTTTPAKVTATKMSSILRKMHYFSTSCSSSVSNLGPPHNPNTNDSMDSWVVKLDSSNNSCHEASLNSSRKIGDGPDSPARTNIRTSATPTASENNTSSSSWAKVKLRFPIRKPQIQGIAAAVHQHQHLRQSNQNRGNRCKVCKERGWRECREKENVSQCEEEGKMSGAQTWNMWWRTTTMTAERSSFLKSWQVTNHIPKISTNFSRKDNLARLLSRMKSNHASEYDFSPKSFILPQEYYRLLTVQRNRYNCAQAATPEEPGANMPFLNGYYFQKDKKPPIWICKPVCKSQGKGIVVFDRVTEFSYDLPSVVQEYIVRPYLINGYKWDLRLYLCITCSNPLTMYAYREGITRFATNKYDLSDLLNQFSHLTNTSLNKQSPEYKKHKDGIGYGCKWTLEKLRGYFRKEEVSDFLLWQKIWSILVLTIIGDAKEITKFKNSRSCFEFLGFDILVDENLKPHLLEVNSNPGLGCDMPTAVDEAVKKPMLHELFTLLGLPDGRQFNIGPTYTNQPEDFLYGNNTAEEDIKALEDLLFGDKETSKSLRLGSNQSRMQSTAPTSVQSLSPCCNQGNSIHYNNASLRLGGNGKNNQTQEPEDIPSCPPSPKEPTTAACDNLLPTLTSESCFSVPQTASTHYFRTCLTAEGDVAINPPISVEVVVPKVFRNRSKPKLTKNGPGMTLQVQNWKETPPNSCGNWVRIFPFNNITKDIAGEQMDDDDVNKIIFQVNELLKLVKEIVLENPNEGYAFYNTCIQRFGSINTDVWYPSIDKI